MTDAFERQRAFQNQLLQQSGGGIDPETPVGTFQFDFQPFVDQRSATMSTNRMALMAVEWLNWCDHELRQQALDHLTHEDLEAHDMMARTYPDHPHPSQRHYIQHVGNGGEYHPRGTNFTVVGYCQDTNTIYEFYGCFWRGCPKCYPCRTKFIYATVIAPWRMSTGKPSKKGKASSAGIISRNCGNTSGPALNKAVPTSRCTWIPYNSWNLSTPVTPSVEDAPMPSNLSSRDTRSKGPLHRLHLLVPPGSTKPASSPKVILSSSCNRATPTSMTTLVSCNAKYYTHVKYTIPCCLTVTLVNSSFLSVPPAWKTKCKNFP